MVWELKCSNPMLDVRFFKDRRFTAANIAITLTFFAMYGQAFIGTQYLQTVLGFDPLAAGLRGIPMALVMLAVAPLAPASSSTKLVVGGGLSIVALALYIFSTVPVTDGYPHMLVGMLLLGGGMGLVMAPATESIMGSLPPAKAGVGSAMKTTARKWVAPSASPSSARCSPASSVPASPISSPTWRHPGAAGHGEGLHRRCAPGRLAAAGRGRSERRQRRQVVRRRHRPRR